MSDPKSVPQPNLSVSPNPVPSEFDPTSDLDVINPEAALDQCCDWTFVVELLEDVLKEKSGILTALQQATDENDHTKFHKTAHALKGAALNLHLPALVDASKKAEYLGKQLEVTPSHKDLLAARLKLITQLTLEYQRLEDYLPEARENAAAEAENGAAGAAGAAGDAEGEGEGEGEAEGEGEEGAEEGEEGEGLHGLNGEEQFEDEEEVVYEDENGNIVDKDGNPIEMK